MAIKLEIRRQVRRRANFACEFCGVSEANAGSELTVDHFQPIAKGGDDDLDNLIYCCPRCNQHKLDYWPAQPDAPRLWNPRREPFSRHFLAFDDGTLLPCTEVAEFTLRRLHLNRPALVDHRRNKILRTRYEEIIRALPQLLWRQAELAEQQQRLLQLQQALLNRLINNRAEDDEEWNT
jgi:hypothetical protein